MTSHFLDQIVRQTNAHTKDAVRAILEGEAARALETIDKGGGGSPGRGSYTLRYAAMARDYAQLSPANRARTFVLDPTREGCQPLTDAMRAELVRNGTLWADAITATTLKPVNLTRVEASVAASYTPGQIITFRHSSREQRLSRGRAYQVGSIDADMGTVSAATPQGKSVIWSPARRGGDQTEAFVEVQQDLRTGDRIQFTRNKRSAGRLNGHTASVIAIGPQRAASPSSARTASTEPSTYDASPIGISGPDGSAPSIPLTAQPPTGSWLTWNRSELTPSMRLPSMWRSAEYVVALYTDSRARLIEALGLRDGAQVGAIGGVRSEVEVEVEVG